MYLNVEDLWFRAPDAGSGSLSLVAVAASGTDFAMVKSIRTSIIVLASLNVVAAAATVAGISWDYVAAARRDGSGLNLRTLRLARVSPAEVFPMVLSCGIIVQGISFAAAQSKGLKAPSLAGCTSVSQLLLPAIFITPYIQVVFGFETALRSLRLRLLQGRVRWAVPICLVIVGVALLATYVVTLVSRPPDSCFASLFWFVQRWKLGCFVLLVLICLTLLVCAGLTFFRLHKISLIDPAERVAASRMIYYLVAAFISIVLTIPFFSHISFGDAEPSDLYSDPLSIVASVVYNLSGLTTGGLYLFLRSSTCATIGPKGYRHFDRQEMKKGIRVRAPSQYIFNNQIQQPLSPPGSFRKSSEDRAAADQARDESISLNMKGRAPTFTQASPLKQNEMTGLAYPPGTVRPMLFRANTEQSPASVDGLAIPATSDTPRALGLPASPHRLLPNMASLNTASGGLLLPPPAIYGPGHRRDSSQVSSATVQIGLRLSNVEDMGPPSSPRTSQTAVSGGMSATVWPAAPPPSGPRRISPLATNVAVAGTDKHSIEESKHKTLPPIPREAAEEEEEEKQVRLSPTVYSPKKTIPQLDAPADPLRSKKASWI